MKTLSLLLALLFQTVILHAQYQEKLLNHAYKTKSKTELKQFFDNWHKEIPPISDSELTKLDTIQRAAYQVFEAFYHPNLYTNFKHWKWDSVYGSSAYLIIQNRLEIDMEDSLSVTKEDTLARILFKIKCIKNDSMRNIYLHEYEKYGLTDHIANVFSVFSSNTDHKPIDSISNFRPKIDCESKIQLYLTSHYDSMLTAFFGRLDGSRLMKSKISFIGNFTTIDLFPNFGLGWELHYLTYPQVYHICFDKSLTRAVVEFGPGTQGEAGLMVKINNQWKFLGFYLTWID